MHSKDYKFMVKTSTIFLLLFFNQIIFGQNDILSVIENSEDHTIFAELLLFTEADTLLTDDGYHSVFAPDDTTILAAYNRESIDSLKISDILFLRNMIMRHIVHDTIVPDYITDPYLPLRGSSLRLFVDAAGNVNVIISGRDRLFGYPRLAHPIYKDELITEVDNGRILWTENEIIRPSICTPLEEVYNVVYDPLWRAMLITGTYDSLKLTTDPLTFIASQYDSTTAYIEENGGYKDTPFLDSFLRRHIISEHLQIQDVSDSYTTENLLGENVTVTKKGKDYFINESKVELFVDYKNVITITVVDYIEEPLTSSTSNISEIKPLKIYPNPASQFVNFYSPQNERNQSLKILNIKGEVVLEETVLNNNFASIDISNYQTGIYFVQHRWGSNTFSQQFIIAH